MYIHNYKYIYKLFVLLGIFIKMTLYTPALRSPLEIFKQVFPIVYLHKAIFKQSLKMAPRRRLLFYRSKPPRVVFCQNAR